MKDKIKKNTFYLMLFQIAKIIFPFITLPYLTRVLSTETYGVVTYLKTIMLYMQIFIDFGFVTSATKDIVKIREDKNKLNEISSNTMFARLSLGIIGFIIVILLSLVLPILKNNFLYTILTYIVTFQTIFLMDFLFRGLEKMHVIAIRFVSMKIISTILTFILIKCDENLLLIPLIDIISQLIAIILVLVEVKKINIKFVKAKIKKVILILKDSFVYFISSIAAQSSNAISTIIIGIYSTTTDVAIWGLCMQIYGTITACYSPIADGIYPEMVKTKNLNIIKRTIKIFAPLILIGCIITYFITPTVFMVLGGDNFASGIYIFRILVPTLFISFFAIIYGFPVLSAIDKQKEASFTTVLTMIVNITLLILLILTNKFTLINIAIVRALTEIILFTTRFLFYKKYKNMFEVK